MNELNYTKQLVREMFDIQRSLLFTSSSETSILYPRLDAIYKELKELSGYED